MGSEAIGKVTATENKPTSCNMVRFWVHTEKIIRPFDIVKIPHIRDSYTYAIVQDLEYITDSAGHLANYVSSDFGDLTSEPHNGRLGTTIAEAEILYNTKEIEMPVRDGAKVEWADVEGIKIALGLDKLKTPIPAGRIRTSNNQDVGIEFEASYLLGPEGAHLNIAGISGLATKTSYAMFLLNSIQQKMSDQVTIIIFNVKGSDLLAIDEKNHEMTEPTRQQWKQCNLEPIPFKNVTYLYPYSRKAGNNYTQSHVEPEILAKQQKENKAFNYFYDVETGRSKLALLFSDIDDPNSTMETIVHSIPEIDAGSWDAFRHEIESKTQAGAKKGGDISVLSWRKFNRLLRTRTENDIFEGRAVKVQSGLSPFITNHCKACHEASSAQNRPTVKLIAAAKSTIQSAQEQIQGGLVSKQERDTLLKEIVQEENKISRALKTRDSDEDIKRLIPFAKELEGIRNSLENENHFAVNNIRSDLDRKQRRILQEILQIIHETLPTCSCNKSDDCFKTLRKAILNKYQIKESEPGK